MGIRTYINVYQEVPDSEVCLGKTDILRNWMTDHDCISSEHEGELLNNAILDYYDIKELLKDIRAVLSSDNKKKSFDSYFRESDYYKDYWSFKEYLTILQRLEESLSQYSKNDTVMVSEW